MDAGAIAGFAGAGVALLSLLIGYLVYRHQVNEAKDERYKEREERATREGEQNVRMNNMEHDVQVLHSRIDKHDEENQSRSKDLSDKMDRLREAGSSEHRELRNRVEDGFSTTDNVLSGLLENVAGIRGELRGLGVIKKEDQ